MTAASTKAVVALGFFTALIGGAVAGLLASRYMQPATPVVVAGQSSLSEELQLTPDQQAQIRRIWQGVQGLNESAAGATAALDRWRTDQWARLLNDEQRKQFEKIQLEYEDRFTAMNAKRDLAFKDAVAKTKQLLNEQQRQHYEEILARRMGSGAGGEALPGSTHPMPTTTISGPSVSEGLHRLGDLG
jgi:hypothetical protein